MKKLIFGPVKSRRLGRSLGIELVPKKVCSMNCIYCEVGETTFLTLERKPYYSWEALEHALISAREKEEISDVITFTGSGEPTLNSNFEKIINYAKHIFKKPLAVLTNSSLLKDPSVLEALKEVDFVLASLDSVREESFKKVNRPHPNLKLPDIIEGLKKLRKEIKGELWLEVLLVKGVNDSEEDLSALKKVLKEINPHKTQLNTVVRPPALKSARPLSFKELQQIANFLGEKTEIIVSEARLEKVISKVEIVNLKEEVLNYLTRRPAPFEELLKAFGNEEKLKSVLDDLLSTGRVIIKKHLNQEYFFAVKNE